MDCLPWYIFSIASEPTVVLDASEELDEDSSSDSSPPTAEAEVVEAAAVSELVTLALELADVETESEVPLLSFARMLACAGTEAVLVAATSSVDIVESVEVAVAIDAVSDVASVSEEVSVLVGDELDAELSVIVEELVSVELELDESESVLAVVAVDEDEDIGSSVSVSSSPAGEKAATSLGPPTTETAGPAGVNTRVTLFGSAPEPAA